MSGKVLTITSGKGGVGKSTSSANIALGLALSGKKVVTIDLDIGLRNLDMILGLENRIVYDVVNVVEKACKLNQALIKDKRTENLFLIAAAQTRDKSAVSTQQIVDLTKELKKDFDYIILDSPAGIEGGFKNAMMPADEVIIITTPEISAVRDADRVIGILEANNKTEASLIINRINPALVKKGDMMSKDDVLQVLSIPLIGIVPEDNNIVSYTNIGEPSILHKESHSGAAYKNIVERLSGKDAPFMEIIEEKRGILQSIINFFKE